MTMDHAAAYRDRLLWSALLAVPVVALSPTFAELLGYAPPAGTGWVSPVAGVVLFGYGGWPFLTGAATEIRQRSPGMMLLISLAISVALVASLAVSLGVPVLRRDVWWELALLIVIMLLGHWLEMRALGESSSALDELASLLPDEAERVVEDDRTEKVTAADIAVGDVVQVRPGGRVPADGRIVAGRADMDESMITGESQSVERAEGDRVVAGTVSVSAAIRVEVEAVGEDTTVAGVQRLVGEAQNSRSRSQALADRAAALLFYVAVTTAAVTFAVWALLGEADEAVRRTATVLVIACPHALGLAIPLVIAISTGRAASAGILVRDRLSLERMRDVDLVMFDKTGTLTTGEHTVTDLVAEGDENGMLASAAAVERTSEHPLGRAIVNAANERGLPIPSASGVDALPGLGIRGEIDGSSIAVGGSQLLGELGVGPSASVRDAAEGWIAGCAGVVYVVLGKVVVGAIRVSDPVRPESSAAVAELHERGIAVALITGDSSAVADEVARQIGIDEVHAEVLPDDKARTVREIQEGGDRVAMVGDGVNDAPALATADVGLAIGAGTDVAIESAGVVLARDDPRAVLSVVDLSRASYRKMQQNLAWAAGYNVLALPLAAGVLAPVGFTLPLQVGAILMSVSTVIVAANAQLLRRIDLSLSPAADSEQGSSTPRT